MIVLVSLTRTPFPTYEHFKGAICVGPIRVLIGRTPDTSNLQVHVFNEFNIPRIFRLSDTSSKRKLVVNSRQKVVGSSQLIYMYWFGIGDVYDRVADGISH
jgi:hypothetical protein